MDEPPNLEKIYTADEVAERLRLKRRVLLNLARKHGACSRAGREYLFSEDDVLAIWQAMREPPATSRSVTTVLSSTTSSHRGGYDNELAWLLSGPPTSVDRRVLRVLMWLDRQKDPKTHKQIKDAGPKTIELLIEKGFVQRRGVDDSGVDRVKISPEGRDQLKIFDKWRRRRTARGLSADYWNTQDP